MLSMIKDQARGGVKTLWLPDCQIYVRIIFKWVLKFLVGTKGFGNLAIIIVCYQALSLLYLFFINSCGINQWSLFSRSAVAQFVEHSSTGAGSWCNSTDMGSKHSAAQGGRKNPSSAICCSRCKIAVWEDLVKKNGLGLAKSEFVSTRPDVGLGFWLRGMA